jgi:hypothetical protein
MEAFSLEVFPKAPRLLEPTSDEQVFEFGHHLGLGLIFRRGCHCLLGRLRFGRLGFGLSFRARPFLRRLCLGCCRRRFSVSRLRLNRFGFGPCVRARFFLCRPLLHSRRLAGESAFITFLRAVPGLVQKARETSVEPQFGNRFVPCPGVLTIADIQHHPIHPGRVIGGLQHSARGHQNIENPAVSVEVRIGKVRGAGPTPHLIPECARLVELAGNNQVFERIEVEARRISLPLFPGGALTPAPASLRNLGKGALIASIHSSHGLIGMFDDRGTGRQIASHTLPAVDQGLKRLVQPIGVVGLLGNSQNVLS